MPFQKHRGVLYEISYEESKRRQNIMEHKEDVEAAFGYY